MPSLGAEGSGATTVQTGGPGSTRRGPLYLKVGPTAGGVYTYNRLFDSDGLMDYNALKPAVLNLATVTIPTASVITLHSVPIDLSTFNAALGAPGAGKIILIDWGVAELGYATATYANGGAFSISYGPGGPVAHPTAIPAALITAAQTEVF